MRTTPRTTLLLLALAALARAQDLTPKAAPQQWPVALVHATIHTVSGDTIENGWIHFARGRIVALGAGEKRWTRMDHVIDLKGKHVYPGFVSARTQLGLSEIGAVRASRDFDEAGALTPEVRAAVAVNPDSTLLPVTRSNGILTFATFPRGGAIPGRMSVMRMDGWTWEDMAIRADGGLVVGWPTERAGRRRRRVDPERDEADRARKTRAQIEQAFADARAYLAARAADPAVPVDLRWEGMRRELAGERPVFFLANEYDQILGALAFAEREHVKAVIVGGRDAHLCTDALRAEDAAVIVDSVHSFPKRADSDYDAVYRLPGKLEAAGVRWCLANGDMTANERNLPYTAARAVAYGLAPDAALRAITLYPARILGVGDKLGSIEEGKAATLIVTDGDPLQVTTNVERAWIDGREIDLSNKQTKLYRKYREKYRQLGLVK